MKTVPIIAPALLAALCLPAFAQEQNEGADRPVAPPAAAERPDYAVEPARDRPIPIGSEYDWLTNADYPIEAWRNGEQGFLAYRLDVDSAGAVTGCRITQSEATPSLEAATCRLLRERARFAPAKDAKAKPVASAHSGYFTWERREPEFGNGSFNIKIAFTIDEQGKTTNCRVIDRSGVVPPDMLRTFERNPCPAGKGGVPARDAEGRPVAHDFILSFAVESSPAAAEGPPPAGD